MIISSQIQWFGRWKAFVMLCVLVGYCGCEKAPPVNVVQSDIPSASPPIQSTSTFSSPQLNPAVAAMPREQMVATALRSGDAVERSAAIRSALKKERGVDTVLETIKQEADGDLRFEMRAALFLEMDRPSALRLVETFSADDPDDIKALVKETAIQFVDAEMLQTIADRFDSLPPESPLRPLLAEIVREVRNPEAIEGLTRMASMAAETDYSQDELAWSAMVALAEIGTAPSVDGIVSIARSMEGEKNAGAGLVFRRIRSSEALSALIPIAKGQGRDATVPVRLQVIPALANFKDEAAVAALEELTRDSDPRIAQTAQTTLQDKNQAR